MLALHSISKSYEDKIALNQVSFDVANGEVVALLGANGSGKTTTIQSICSLVIFDEGDITFDGQSVKNNRRYLKKIGAVLDGSRNINWRLTVEQNAGYFARLKGARSADVKPYIQELEERLGLAQYRGTEVMKLSTGNRQKASLLCALMHSPQLLLLDEPTLGLDLQTVSELQSIITSQAQTQQQGFLITSHDMSFIDQICTKVVVLEQGCIVYQGAIDELKKQLFQYELLIKSSVHNLKAVRQQIARLPTGEQQLDTNDSELRYCYNSVPQVLPILAWLEQQNWQPESLEIQKLNIEKAYRTLIINNN